MRRALLFDVLGRRKARKAHHLGHCALLGRHAVVRLLQLLFRLLFRLRFDCGKRLDRLGPLARLGFYRWHGNETGVFPLVVVGGVGRLAVANARSTLGFTFCLFLLLLLLIIIWNQIRIELYVSLKKLPLFVFLFSLLFWLFKKNQIIREEF